MKVRRVTAIEVSKAAGCSVSQVGAAFGFYSGYGMSPEEADRIIRVANEMGFKRRARTGLFAKKARS